MVKNMKNSKEFYKFMLQAIVDLNSNAEYYNYNKFINRFSWFKINTKKYKNVHNFCIITYIGL